MTTKEYNNTEIAKRVELLRKRSGMSINKMATMAGIDTGNLSRSINGKASFSDRVIYKIASALHVSVDWLEKGIEPMFSPTVASPSEVGAGIIGSNIDASNSKGFTQTISPTDALFVMLVHCTLLSFGIRVTDTYINADLSRVDEANRRVIDYVLYNKK